MANISEDRIIDVKVCSILEEGHGVGERSYVTGETNEMPMSASSWLAHNGPRYVSS
jgi:hypothetical protein